MVESAVKVTKQRNPMKYTRKNSDGTGAFQMFFLFPIKHFQVQNVRFRKAKGRFEGGKL